MLIQTMYPKVGDIYQTDTFKIEIDFNRDAVWPFETTLWHKNSTNGCWDMITIQRDLTLDDAIRSRNEQAAKVA